MRKRDSSPSSNQEDSNAFLLPNTSATNPVYWRCLGLSHRRRTPACNVLQYKVKPEALHLLSLLWSQMVLLFSGSAPAQAFLQEKKSFNLTTESALITGLCTNRLAILVGDFFFFFFFRDTHVVCCHENYFRWNKNFVFREGVCHLIIPNLQENLSFFFRNEKQVRWRFVSEQSKQTFAVTCFSGQTKYFIHPTLKAKTSVSWHVKPECKSASIQVNRLEV